MRSYKKSVARDIIFLLHIVKAIHPPQEAQRAIEPMYQGVLLHLSKALQALNKPLSGL